ncbi:hypothetical protein E6C67_08185 [Azospirillum sp. TSA2s]|uniref:LuxR C-terminal-related transcriptional regulator n=1 Tax=Azospirillum sp. TSA2s TaxID=709810 RepID=UPI0010AA4C6E|nr:LuxR C-terminal-related transcriptional regulator [Azospirillum sp. TSA2s]QCG93919.1 hypothetical protein E6C67_08185 [Azospirillum sp. TSA2s]
MDATVILPWSFPQPYAISGVTNHAAPPACNPTALFTGLSGRERMACIWAAAGLGNKEVALRMGITEATVKVHLKAAMRKMGIYSRCALVAIVRPAGAVGKDVEVTPEEASFLRNLYAARSYGDIAYVTGDSESLTKSKARAIFKKIGVSGRVEAARWWFSRRVEG